MGKTRKNSSASAASGIKAPKRKGCKWTKSTGAVKLLSGLEREGLLRPKAENEWRRPGKETRPTPTVDERVAFTDHVTRGVSFPLHPFLVSLLCVYGMQLHDVPPNSIQYLACFFILCECYLGIAPHWALFKWLIVIKRPAKQGGPP